MNDLPSFPLPLWTAVLPNHDKCNVTSPTPALIFETNDEMCTTNPIRQHCPSPQQGEDIQCMYITLYNILTPADAKWVGEGGTAPSMSRHGGAAAQLTMRHIGNELTITRLGCDRQDVMGQYKGMLPPCGLSLCSPDQLM
jgi:hypothetical protein